MWIIKAIRIILWILAYIFVGTIASLLIFGRVPKRKFAIRLTAFVSIRVLKILGGHIHCTGLHHLRQKTNNSSGRLVVSNHFSYVDVLVMASQYPLVFVTSVETENAPFLGLVSRIGGSLFVERRNRTRIKADIAQITKVLKEGFDVVVFPEGTSSNGSAMHPFKKSLINAAVEAGSDVLPICLNYKTINHHKITPENRDLIFWYDDMTFGPHFSQSLKVVRQFHCEVKVLDAISHNVNQNRKDISQQAQDQILNHFVPVI